MNIAGLISDDQKFMAYTNQWSLPALKNFVAKQNLHTHTQIVQNLPYHEDPHWIKPLF